MSGVPFVRMYASDWFAGCVGLKADERGVYISMCVYIWTAGRRVPLDDAEAARMMCLQFNNYQRLKRSLICKGKVQEHDDGYGIKRAERELDQARNRSATGATAGDGRRSDETASRHDQVGAAAAHEVRPGHDARTEIGHPVLGAPVGAPVGAPIGTLAGAPVGAPVGACQGSGEKDQQNQWGQKTLNTYYLREEKRREESPLPPNGGEEDEANNRDVQTGRGEPRDPCSPSEPACAALPSDPGAALQTQPKTVASWATAFGPPVDVDGVGLVDGRLVLSQPVRATWLADFGGDVRALDLALVEIRGQVQPNSRAHSLAVQVNRHLARIVRDRSERDRRYAAAAAKNARPVPTHRGVF